MAQSHATLPDYLSLLARQDINPSLTGILRGIEREALRVTHEGALAQTPHPEALGKALTHPHITTDYSEALLEFITEPFNSIDALLSQLTDIHQLASNVLAEQGEQLWPTSMPCCLPDDNDIPVARYGSSNVGQMKTVYRLGLGHRYGRAMQTIAGVHYNFSLPDDLWQALQQQEGSSESLTDYKTRRYFDLIRNFRRYFWLMVYLFGAAPALNESFVKGKKHRLQPLTKSAHTQYLPFATSLRMGDLGYQSAAQQQLMVDYNNLPDYLDTLCGAIAHSHPAYEAIGVKDAHGHYQQLSTGLLQIENEFYSSIRPKRTARASETALTALRSRGVEYVEVRCTDVNLFEPLGVSEEQLRVMDAFLLFCLFEPSPETLARDYQEDITNQQAIVYEGRKPGLTLHHQGNERLFSEWAKTILEKTLDYADRLDQANGGAHYRNSVQAQFAKVDDASLTPAARIVQQLSDQQASFFDHSLALATEHRAYFATLPVDAQKMAVFNEMAQTSVQAQQTLESQSTKSFEQYLADYYRQYQDCRCRKTTATE